MATSTATGGRRARANKDAAVVSKEFERQPKRCAFALSALFENKLKNYATSNASGFAYRDRFISDVRIEQI